MGKKGGENFLYGKGLVTYKNIGQFSPTFFFCLDKVLNSNSYIGWYISFGSFIFHIVIN